MRFLPAACLIVATLPALAAPACPALAGRYRITGNVGGSVFQSVTVYSGTGIADAAAVARVDTDDLTLAADGGFSLDLAPGGSDLDLPTGARSVWIRHLHNDIRHDRAGWCRIDPIDPPAEPPPPDDARFTRDLARLGTVVSRLPDAFRFAVAEDAASPNSVRHWAAMAGGAAFTEPDIHYVRGAWRLGHDEALLIEGDLVDCRHWNILLYSRFLNSLDHRNRTVSRTATSSTITDGRYRFVLAARDPGIPGHDWLDTEGREFGLFVMRFMTGLGIGGAFPSLIAIVAENARSGRIAAPAIATPWCSTRRRGRRNASPRGDSRKIPSSPSAG